MMYEHTHLSGDRQRSTAGPAPACTPAWRCSRTSGHRRPSPSPGLWTCLRVRKGRMGEKEGEENEEGREGGESGNSLVVMNRMQPHSKKALDQVRPLPLLFQSHSDDGVTNTLFTPLVPLSFLYPATHLLQAPPTSTAHHPLHSLCLTSFLFISVSNSH